VLLGQRQERLLLLHVGLEPRRYGRLVHRCLADVDATLANFCSGLSNRTRRFHLTGIVSLILTRPLFHLEKLLNSLLDNHCYFSGSATPCGICTAVPLVPALHETFGVSGFLNDGSPTESFFRKANNVSSALRIHHRWNARRKYFLS
jgi:hypothetical protein